MEQHFTILMNGYNSRPWIKASIESALFQKYTNFDVICMDAQTTDGTYDILKEYESKYKNVRVFRNEIRRYQTENILNGVINPKPGSIIATLDFDDWLNRDDVLLILNNVYTQDVWMTYGTYIHHPYRDVSSYYFPYPNDVIKTNSFRKYPRWLASHLRTFRRELFLRIDRKNFFDVDGQYFKMAGDLSFMYPMLEMAGERSRYIPQHLYVYNRTNDLSDDKVDIKNQERIAELIKSIPPSPRLESL